MKKPIQVDQHILVPKHEKISADEIKELYEKHNISFGDLPKMFLGDPAIAQLGAKDGDIIKITRISETAGESIFYRGVINE